MNVDLEDSVWCRAHVLHCLLQQGWGMVGEEKEGGEGREAGWVLVV